MPASAEGAEHFLVEIEDRSRFVIAPRVEFRRIQRRLRQRGSAHPEHAR